MLAKKAANLNLGEYMLFGLHEQRSGGARRDSNLANALEALFGAYYLDRKNIKVVNEFIVTLMEDIIKEAIEPSTIIDAKSALQEYAQKQGLVLPEYDVIKEEGPDHDKTFEVKALLIVNGNPYQATAQGKTKKEAEQTAARTILEIISGV